MKLQNADKAEDYIKEIFSFDVKRIGFAVDSHSFSLFNYFIENAVFNNIFYYPDFAGIADRIENFLSLNRIPNEAVIKILINKFELFNLIIEEKTFPEDITRKISFLSKVITKYGDSTNLHFLNAAEQLKSKFLETINNIKEDIEKKYYKDINKKITEINGEIKNKNQTIDQLSVELENEKLELKNKFSAAAVKLETKASDDIQNLENEIKDLPFKAKLNPQTAFKHAMTYNVMLSFMVFLMGGCAGYSNSFVHDISELKDLIAVSFITGIKWGVITFLIGIILSGLSSVFTLLERSNRRQRLLLKITEVKNEKERDINYLKKELADREAGLTGNYNSEIEGLKEEIRNLEKQKELQQTTLKHQADKLIEEEYKPYAFLLDEEKEESV
jgi:hypothetical protein